MDDDEPQDKPARTVGITPEKAAAATGALSEAARLHLLRQVLSCLWSPEGTPQEEVDRQISAAIDRMVELAPADPAEGMLAAQMMGTHEAAMECLRRAMLPNQTFAGRDQNLKHATKLMSLYERQLAALDKRRGRGQQKVTVEHVHVAAGGQAIVGSVTTGGRERIDPPAPLDSREAPRARFNAAPAKEPVKRRLIAK